MAVDDFPAKLDLALKILSLSRGRLAAALQLDKSVIGRWANGVSAPTAHNLSKLTNLIATLRPGFSTLDWEGDIEAVARSLGRSTKFGDATPSLGGLGDWLPEAVVREAMLTTEARGSAYEGFWRSTRPSNDEPGQFVHDRILIRRGDHGLLTFRLTVVDMVFQGVAFPTQTQLFSLCADAYTGVFIFTILNAVLRHRADVMDGLTLTLQRTGGGSPVAAPVMIERTGLLTEDSVEDDDLHAALARRDPRAPEGSVPASVAAHLNRDVGPAAFAAGGAFLLSMPFAQTISRGPQPGLTFPE